MKKNEDLNCFCRSGKIKKWLLLMKLITFFSFFANFQPDGYSPASRSIISIHIRPL